MGLGMWFVWNANGKIPKFVHQDSESAKKEAERLAKLNPGEEFHILHSVAFCVKQEVKWETLPNVSMGELPF